MGDASRTTTDAHAFFQQKKRTRTEAETNPVNINTNTRDGDDISGASASTSNTLNTNALQVNANPTLQINNLDLSASTDTVISNPAYAEREKENLAFRLDKLNDKKCRYESHEAFLKKCLDNNLVPNGLKVYVEPSIGNRDDDFLQLWHSRLDEFSKTLAKDVVNYCEREIAKTKNEITEIGDRLKVLVTPPEFTDISKTIQVNEKSRVNELGQRKNRKFYRLKYYNTNEDRTGNRNQAEAQRSDRERTTQRWNGGQQQQQPSRDLYNNRGHRGMRMNNSDRTHTREARNDGINGNYSSSDQSDHDERVIATIEQRRHNHRYNDNYDMARSGQTGQRNYAAALRNDRGNGNHERYDDNSTRRQNNGNQSRRPSFQNLMREQENEQNDVHPLHERIALSRRNSRRNIGQNGNQGNQGNRPRNEDNGNGDNGNQGHGRPRNDVGNASDKDREIADLRSRLRTLEQNQPERVLLHHVPNTETSQKNDNGAQREKGQNTTDITEMKKFLVGVLETISAFDRRLTTQLNTSPTPSDK